MKQRTPQHHSHSSYFVRGMRAAALIAVLIGIAGYTTKWLAALNMALYIYWSVLDE